PPTSMARSRASSRARSRAGSRASGTAGPRRAARRMLVAARAIHRVKEGLARQEAREIFHEELGHHGVRLWVKSADMRQHRDARRAPEGMLGGQGLLAE